MFAVSNIIIRVIIVIVIIVILVLIIMAIIIIIMIIMIKISRRLGFIITKLSRLDKRFSKAISL